MWRNFLCFLRDTESNVAKTINASRIEYKVPDEHTPVVFANVKLKKNRRIMKLVKILTCVIFLCSAAMLNSCQKDDINPSGSSTSPNLSQRGGLLFKVTDEGGDPLKGVTLSIAESERDLASGKFLITRDTDLKGKADFGMLNAGEYYYHADIAIRDMHYHGEGMVRVQAGQNLTQELTLR
jgi:hypothetical protein